MGSRWGHQPLAGGALVSHSHSFRVLGAEASRLASPPTPILTHRIIVYIFMLKTCEISLFVRKSIRSATRFLQSGCNQFVFEGVYQGEPGGFYDVG